MSTGKPKSGAHSSQLYGSQKESYNSKFYCTHSDPEGSLTYVRVDNYCQQNFVTTGQVKTLLKEGKLVGKKFKHVMFVGENPDYES